MVLYRSSWTVSVLAVLVACSAEAQQPTSPAPNPAEAAATAEAAANSEADRPAEPAPVEPPSVALPEIPETTVLGQPDPFPGSPLGPQTVLSPTRTESLIGETASSLTVITQDQIDTTRQTQVSEVLRNVPGLDVVQQSGPGSLTSVFIRGAASQHTKVLIDGIPMNDPGSATRGFDFSQLSIDNIERIEVLRGPQSTLYGSDAIGGVIYIVTKRGQGPLKVNADFMGGSYGTAREAITASGGTRDYHYSFGASYLQQDGFSAATSGVEDDGTRNGNFSGRFGWTPSRDFDVDYVFRYADRDTEIDNFDFFLGPIDDPSGIRESRSEAFFNRVQARLSLLDGFWEQKVGFNLTDYERRDTDPPLFFDPQFLGQSRSIDYQSNFLLGRDHTLSVGVSYYHEDAGIFSLLEREQNMSGIWVEDQLRLWDQVFLTAGARWENHSAAGPADTYRVTGLYRAPGTRTGLHGSIGTGFRAPALEELFNSWVGNPNLRPERSFGWDCGIEQPFWDGRLLVDATYFRNDFTDLIQFDFATFTLNNVGRSFSSGVETLARYQLNRRTALTATYVHTFTEDLETGLALLRRPRHKATFTVDRQCCLGSRPANLYLNLIYTGPRLDNSPTGNVDLEEYFLLNLAGSWDWTDTCQLYARLDNLLDDNYQEVFGYNTAALSFYGGVRLRY